VYGASTRMRAVPRGREAGGRVRRWPKTVNRACGGRVHDTTSCGARDKFVRLPRPCPPPHLEQGQLVLDVGWVLGGGVHVPRASAAHQPDQDGLELLRTRGRLTCIPLPPTPPPPSPPAPCCSFNRRDRARLTTYAPTPPLHGDHTGGTAGSVPHSAVATAWPTQIRCKVPGGVPNRATKRQGVVTSDPT
jgi:hypothetical protein